MGFRVAALLGFILAVSACVDDTSTNVVGSLPPIAPRSPVEFSENEGAIVGRVISEEYLPVAGANVTLFGGGAKDARANITDFEGRFQFNHVPIGVYSLLSNANGYEPRAQGATVDGGRVIEMTLVLVAIPPETVPHYVTLNEWHGYVGCALGLYAVASQDLCKPIDAQSNATNRFPVGKHLNAIHWEMHWQSSAALSARHLLMNWIHPIGYGFDSPTTPPEKERAIKFCDRGGASPISVNCEFYQNATRNGYWEKADLFGEITVRANGNSTFPNPSNPASWLDGQTGPMITQRFTAYFSLFYGGLPVPAGFTNGPG